MVSCTYPAVLLKLTTNIQHFLFFEHYRQRGILVKILYMTEIGGMVTALIIAVVAIFNGVKWKEISNGKRAVILVAVIGSIFMFINQNKAYKKAKIIDRINATFGDIKDIKNATLPLVVIGNSNVKFAPAQGSNGVVRLLNGIEFKVYIKNDKLFINIVIRNSKGEVIVKAESTLDTRPCCVDRLERNFNLLPNTRVQQA